MTADQIRSLRPALVALLKRFGPFFKQQNTFQYFLCYITGLLAELKRKSIEPIALAAGVPVRTLQEFLSFFAWDDRRVDDSFERLVADEHASAHAIGILDASSHPKTGTRRRACKDNGGGAWAKSTTAWWANTCCTPTITPPIRSVVFWPATCTCPKVGPTIVRVAARRAFPTT